MKHAMGTTTADKIRSLRRDHGLTQEDLVAMSGCSLATVQRAERGNPLSAATLSSIAAAFDVEVSDLGGCAQEASKPYLPLLSMMSGRTLIDLLAGATRLDFDFVELETLDQASEIDAFHRFCTRLIEEREAATPIARTTRELEAKAMLARLARSEFIVSGGAFEISCYEVDDDGGMGLGIVYGQWDEKCAAVRVGIGGAVPRAEVLDRLGKYESPKGGTVVFPPCEIRDQENESSGTLKSEKRG